MKTGLTLQEMATELTRQLDAKQDYIADTRKMSFEPVESGSVQLTGLPDGDMKIKPRAHAQFSALTKVPKVYYDRMLCDAPDLLAQNLNHWLHSGSQKRLVRTMDGEVRAVLSDRYRSLDNYDFVSAVLPAIQKWGCEVKSCDVTEDKLYLKLIKPDLQELILPEGAEMGKGHNTYHELQAGLVLGNSEVGAGKLFAQPAVHNTGCTNLAVRRENAFGRTHLGRKLTGGDDDNIQRYITDQTRRKEDELIWSTLRDVAEASLDGRIFHDAVAEMRAKQGVELPKEDTVQAVEKLNDRFGLNETEGKSVLDHLMQGSDLSLFGYHNAVTQASQDVDNYTRASELEVIGGDIIDLTERDYKVVVNAN